MKHIFVTKDLNSLVVTSSIYTPKEGFDLLDNNKFKQFNDLIEISIDCKLLNAILHNIDLKYDLALTIFDTEKERAYFLGLSERNYYRLKEKFINEKELWKQKNKTTM